MPRCFHGQLLVLLGEWILRGLWAKDKISFAFWNDHAINPVEGQTEWSVEGPEEGKAAVIQTRNKEDLEVRPWQGQALVSQIKDPSKMICRLKQQGRL